MAFLQLNAASLAFGDRDILNKCSLFLKEGSRAALCGANGSGKTTLLTILAGIIPPDSGGCVLEKSARAAYLPQSGAVHAGTPLLAEAEMAFAPLAALLDEAAAMGAQLESAQRDDAKTAALLDAQHKLITRVEESGYYYRDKKIAQTLRGLGFSERDFEKDCAEFSGGWQMRIALAKVLLSNPDILLLDEPTNYLDIEARAWLENFIARFSGAVLLVSHDRYFLDTTVNEVYELFNGRLTRYAGNYSAYEKTRALEIETLIARYHTQQNEIEKNEELIRRFRYKASKAAFAQERIKKLEKMERVELPEHLKRIEIKLPPPPHSGKVALTLNNVSKHYGEHTVLSDISLTLSSGERLCVVGVNGAGKTTLLRIIAGADNGGADTSAQGRVVYGAGIVPAYFNQDAAETITGGETILEYLESRAPLELIPKLRDMAGAFLFRGDDVYKTLSVLSGGEKSRLALLALLLRPANLLVLDEPTNHLDINAKDILLDALRAWTGTIIFVSHDRAFMEALSTKTLELRADARHALFYGGYAYYIERAEERPEDAPVKETPRAPAYLQADKREKIARRRRERENAALIEAIEKLEAEKAALELEMSRPEVYTSGEKMKAAQIKLAEITARIDEATNQFLQSA